MAKAQTNYYSGSHIIDSSGNKNLVEAPFDAVSNTVAVETVTTTQQTVQPTDDAEVQITGETQKLSSPLVMMPTTQFLLLVQPVDQFKIVRPLSLFFLSNFIRSIILL